MALDQVGSALPMAPLPLRVGSGRRPQPSAPATEMGPWWRAGPKWQEACGAKLARSPARARKKRHPRAGGLLALKTPLYSLHWGDTGFTETLHYECFPGSPPAEVGQGPEAVHSPGCTQVLGVWGEEQTQIPTATFSSHPLARRGVALGATGPAEATQAPPRLLLTALTGRGPLGPRAHPSRKEAARPGLRNRPCGSER